MAVAIDQFAKSLAVSGILSTDEIKSLYEALPPEERPRDGEAFAKLLTARGKLTEFQAQNLLAGRAAALTVGEYVLQDRIGAGGMGQVFKARHMRMHRTVALKMMSPTAMKDEASVKRFQREVRAAARLEHQNIVTAYDAGQAGKIHFLVMQFVDGGDLAQLVKAKGPLPIEQACNFIAQAARGLGYAHAEGVIHRDIKPANLLIDKKGSIKILDMGLARVVEGHEELTGSEQVMGTVDYMSPEQASEAKQADARSDIYSLGCTLWFLLTGKRLFDGEALVTRLMKHRDEPPPSLVHARDDAPWSLEQTLHKMIAKNPADRFQSMDEVAKALEQFCGRGGASGMGSSVLRDTELASFLHGMGSQVGGASKIGAGSSGSRPGASNVLRPGSSSGELLPLPSVLTGGDSQSGSRPGSRPQSNIHAAATLPGTISDTNSGPSKSNPRNSGVGRASNIGRGGNATGRKKKNALPLILGVVVVACVATAGMMLAKKPASGPVAETPPSQQTASPPTPAVPAAPVAKPVDPEAERRAANWVMSKGGMVGLAALGQASVVEYRDRAPLPAGNWSIRRISLADKKTVGDGEFVVLGPLAEMESLVLNKASLTFRCIPHIGKLTTLKILELNELNVRDADLDYLVGMTTLTTLCLHGSSVSEDGIVKLKRLPLQRLEIGSIVCGNDLGKALAQFPQLHTLRLNSVGLQDEGFTHLSQLKNLSILALNGLPITDAALQTIAGWSQLRELSLAGGSLTPAGLNRLAALTELRRLDLGGLGNIQNEMTALQKAMPKTEIWLNGVRAAPKDFPAPSEPPPAVPHNTLSTEEQAAGWKLLFDGVSFAGWKQWRGPQVPGGWWVVDGELRTDAGGPFLATEQEFDFYELSLEFRMGALGNSGVYYHADELQDPPSKTGPELELVPDQRLGTIWNVGPQQGDARLNPSDAWHRIRLMTAPVGSKHEIFSPDGKLLWARSYLKDSPEVRNSQAVRDSSIFWNKTIGRIVLQSRDGSVAFRNIKLRPLPAAEAEKLVGGN